MKFVELRSRGGDYLVVAANIAYLRADEYGQTKVGLIGGDALLVVGSMAEIAAQIMGESVSAGAGAGDNVSTSAMGFADPVKG